MIKFFAVYALILVVLAVFSGKKNSTAQKAFFYLHLIGGVLLTGFGLFHGIGHLLSAPLRMQLTGGIMLVLLIAELLLGICVYRKEMPRLKKIHLWLAIIILCLMVLHLILLKLF